MRLTVLPLAALALAACSQTETAPGQEPAATASPSVAATTPSAASTATAIPDRFRGVWNNASGNCNPASDLRMDIGAVSIEFYESRGAVTGVTVEAPDSIVVDLAMEGEGERWIQRRAYSLSADNRELTTSVLGEAPDIAFQLKRCPA